MVKWIERRFQIKEEKDPGTMELMPMYCHLSQIPDWYRPRRVRKWLGCHANLWAPGKWRRRMCTSSSDATLTKLIPLIFTVRRIHKSSRLIPWILFTPMLKPWKRTAITHFSPKPYAYKESLPLMISISVGGLGIYGVDSLTGYCKAHCRNEWRTHTSYVALFAERNHHRPEHKTQQ